VSSTAKISSPGIATPPPARTCCLCRCRGRSRCVRHASRRTAGTDSTPPRPVHLTRLGAARLMELLEEARLVLGGDPHACVAHGYVVPIFGPGAHVHVT